MVEFMYAFWILLPISTYLVSGASTMSNAELTKILCRYKTVGDCRESEFTLKNIDLDEVNAKIEKRRDQRKSQAPRQATKPKTKKPSFKSKKKNRRMVLKALKQIIKEDLIQKGNYDVDEISLSKLNKKYLDFISAADLYYKVMENRRHKEQKSKIYKRSISEFQETDIPETLKDIKPVAEENSMKMSNSSRTVRSAKLKDDIINKVIDETNKKRDLVLEAVSVLINNEKLRQQLDLVNPPNSKYNKRQQLLWDRIRLKATEELLIHPKPLPHRVTERVYDNFKTDLEYATPGPIEQMRPFDDFKSRVEQEYYLNLADRGKERVLISTLKPDY